MIKTNYAEIEKLSETKILVTLWQFTGDCKTNIIDSRMFNNIEEAGCFTWNHAKTFKRISFKKLN